MRKWIRKRRRARLVNLIIKGGDLLRDLRSYRAGLNADIHPEECQHVDTQINRVERRMDALRTALKETA